MKRENTALLLVLILAFGLRVLGLAAHNIWWDEGVSVWAARMPAPELLRWTAHDTHPPLYYLLLRGWWLLVGDGEFVLRFLSVLVSTLGVAAIYRFGTSLGGRRAGLLAALLFALSRFAIGWSREIRMYALATTLSVGVLWAAVGLWRGGRWPIWVAYVTMTAAALLTIYLTGLVLIIANLGFIIAWLHLGRPRRLLLRWGTAQLAVLLLLVPWMAYALPRMLAMSASEPLSPLFFLHLYATTLAVGLSVNIEAYTTLTLAVFALVAVGTLVLWRARRSAEQRAGLSLLVIGVALPALTVYALSSPGNPFFGRPLAPRYFLPLSVCFYALGGWGVAALAERRRWAGILGAGLTVVVALSGLAPFYAGQARRDDYKSLVATLEAHLHPSDEVVLHTDKDWPIFAAHYPGHWHGVPSRWSIDAPIADSFLNSIWSESEAIWLVSTPDAQRADPSGHMAAWLASRAAITHTWSFGENALSLYARTADRAETIKELGPDFKLPERPQAQFPSGARLVGANVALPRYLRGDTVHIFLYWSSPPEEAFKVELAGPAEDEQRCEAPSPARHGLTRQQIDVPLTPDLSAGRYRLFVRSGDESVEVGQFTLVRRSVNARASHSDIAHPLQLRLGESIELVGYDLAEAVVEQGGSLELTLYWRASEAVDERYKVFVHILGETLGGDTNGHIWVQQDNEPVNWQAPTTVWTPGVVVADPYTLPMEETMPPGRYVLRVGMYGLVDGDRLPVFGPNGDPQGDAIILTQIEVKAR